MNEPLLKELGDFLKANKLEFRTDNINEIYSITWKSKIELTCLDCGKQFEITVKQLLRPHPERQGLVCPRCEAERLYRNKMTSTYGNVPYEFVTEFIGYNEPLTVRCLDCEAEFTASAARNLLMSRDLPEGAHPCKQCANIRNFKKDISEFENQLVEKFGTCNYEFLTPEDFSGAYSKKKIKVKCKLCGNEFDVNPQNILNPKNGKHYCKECNIKNNTLKNIPKVISVKAPEEKVVATTNTIAINVDVTAKNTTSTAKKELKEWFATMYTGNVKYDSDEGVEGHPVDIYVPEKKVAIDLCLLKNNNHYHVEKKFHINRTYAYEESGIRLIQIFEDEWESHPEIVKSKLQTIFGKNTDTIYARKCKVVEVQAPVKNTFMNKYHIQGEDRAAFSKALMYDGEIVAIMTFIKPRLALGSKTGSTVNEYELSRYASSRHVVGGFSKLFKAILSEHPDIEKIKTFADIRWSSLTENVYVKNGFVQKHISDPNYWYFDTVKTGKELKRIHRFNFRKQELVKKFPAEYNSSLTEFQIMDKTTYARVFDCGNLVYEYIIK